MNTKLIIVGGFLGAGKTTFLHRLAQRYSKTGKVIGFITNDQAEDLVDSRFLLREAKVLKEINGSCFCCNYNGFADAINDIANTGVDLIVAEPVGSCTDISATILQPLKDKIDAQVEMSPYSVLADPERLEAILSGNDCGLHPDALYIYRKQLEESDIIVITKADLIGSLKRKTLEEKVQLFFPEKKIFSISSETGFGVENWLAYILKTRSCGNTIADIDYDIYARGEAMMGWMNASMILYGKETDWDGFLQDYFNVLYDMLRKLFAPIAHIKIMIEAPGGDFILGNITTNERAIKFRGSAGRSHMAELIINSRVELPCRLLNKVVFDALSVALPRELTHQVKQCKFLQPGYPRPVHRYQNVIQS